MIYLYIYIGMMVLSYGVIFNFWQNYFPAIAKEGYKKDMRDSIFMSFVWPIIILLVSIDSKRKNIKLGLKFY